MKCPEERGGGACHVDGSTMAFPLLFMSRYCALHNTVQFTFVHLIYYIWIYARYCVVLTKLCLERASLVAELAKNPPAMQETLVRFLGWEDPLEKGVVTHSSILAWRIPRDRGAKQATVLWVAKSWTRLSD